MIVVGVLVVLHPDRLTDQLDLFTEPELRRHRLRGGAGDARLRRDRGRLQPRPRHRRQGERDLKRIVSRRCDRGAAGLRRDGGDRADGGAGRRRAARAGDGARRTSSSRSRCSGSSPPYHPNWVADADALDGRADRRAGPLLGGDDVDARRLPPHLHAGDQPPDPELARQAEQPLHDAPRRDRDLRRDRDRPGRCRPTSSCWPASTPSAPPWRSRSPTSRSSGCGSSEPDRERPFRIAGNVRWRGAQLPLPAIVRGAGQRPRLRQRPHLPRSRPLGRRRLDGVRARLLRRSTARSSRAPR